MNLPYQDILIEALVETLAWFGTGWAWPAFILKEYGFDVSKVPTTTAAAQPQQKRWTVTHRPATERVWSRRGR